LKIHAKPYIMKKLIILLFVVGISTQLFAEITVKQVVGKWNYTVLTDQGNLSGALKFTEKEGKLSGEVIADDGSIFSMTKVEIKEGNILYFELKPEYDVIKVNVKIEGDKYKGTVTFPQGETAVTGSKTE